MKGYNEIDYARDLIRWMESGQKIRDRGVAAGFELPHSLAKLPETATPPLAPCEPSAEEVRPELDRLRAENRRLQDALNAGVEHVCRSFMKWRDALEANPTNGCAASVSTLDTVFLAIRKSSMLARLVYGCEPLRTVKCPAHKGKWSGLEGMDNVCPHGCQLTGWLPANDDALSRASAPPAKGDGAK